MNGNALTIGPSNAAVPVLVAAAGELARGLQRRLAYHTWRERRLADGFATAPSRTAPQDEAIAQALGLGRPTIDAKESQNDARGFVVGDDAEYAFARTMISLWEGVRA